MTKIEEIEELKRGWKAAEESTDRAEDPFYWEHCHAQVLGLSAALNVFKRPSNLENATGALCVCPLCNQPHDPKLISGDGPMTDGHR